MRQLLLTYSKNNIIILLSCVVLVALNIAGIVQFETIAYILLAMFVFDINVNDKTKGNWNYLESLPISLPKRYILKVLIPFAILILVSFGMQDRIDLLFFVDASASEAILSVTILILASLLASKLNRFILYVLGLYFVSAFLSFLPYSELSVSILYMIMSYYVLSNYRVTKSKVVAIAIAAILPVTLGIHFFEDPIYRSMLKSKEFSTSYYGAKNLIYKNHDQYAIEHLTAIVAYSEDSKEVRKALKVLDRNDVKISFTKEKWLDLFQKHKRARDRVLDYFRDSELRPDWISHENLIPFEEVLLKSSKCRSECRSLARLVSSSSLTLNKERVKELLGDKNKTKKQYALKIINRIDSTEYRMEVVELLDHEDESVQELALEYLSELTEDNLKLELRSIKDALIEDRFSKANIDRAKKFFQSAM